MSEMNIDLFCGFVLENLPFITIQRGFRLPSQRLADNKNHKKHGRRYLFTDNINFDLYFQISIY